VDPAEAVEMLRSKRTQQRHRHKGADEMTAVRNVTRALQAAA
jgi:hypothetical protein